VWVRAGARRLSGTFDIVIFFLGRPANAWSSIGASGRALTVDASNTTVRLAIRLIASDYDAPIAIRLCHQELNESRCRKNRSQYRADFGSAYQVSGSLGLWARRIIAPPAIARALRSAP